MFIGLSLNLPAAQAANILELGYQPNLHHFDQSGPARIDSAWPI
ncbi:hypothetical protein [Mesorhizobium captivum]|nr:hypothetical protein [Mesorhizobium sp. VK3C]MDX8449988.1 hypothetical protein [Mesorhizobium sp. VK3C]